MPPHFFFEIWKMIHFSSWTGQVAVTPFAHVHKRQGSYFFVDNKWGCFGLLCLSLTRYYPSKSLGAGPDADIDEKALLEVQHPAFRQSISTNIMPHVPRWIVIRCILGLWSGVFPLQHLRFSCLEEQLHWLPHQPLWYRQWGDRCS